MDSVFDDRESEYFSYKFMEWQEKNPNWKDILLKGIIDIRDKEAIEKNALYLDTVDTSIPNHVIKIMLEAMADVREDGATKYGMYRVAEDYVCKSEWFSGLSQMIQINIRFDFYKNVIIGISEAYCRIS